MKMLKLIRKLNIETILLQTQYSNFTKFLKNPFVAILLFLVQSPIQDRAFPLVVMAFESHLIWNKFSVFLYLS